MKVDGWGGVLGIVVVAALALTSIVAGATLYLRAGRDADTPAQADAASAEIALFAFKVQEAVAKLKANGCADHEISFENAIVPGYVNPKAPVTRKCHVFASEGGGLEMQKPKPEWLITESNAKATFYKGATFGEYNVPLTNAAKGAGSDPGPWGSTNDLTLTLSYLKPAICDALNRRLGVPTADGVHVSDGSKFAGTYSDWGGFIVGDPTGPKAACKTSTRTGNAFFAVLLAR